MTTQAGSGQEAVVVGSGPNGLAAAIELARLGYQVTVYEGAAAPGGGARTMELIEPGHLHDVCSAAHPLGALSPFFNSLPLEDHGLEWISPAVAVSHPLGDGRAVGIELSMAATESMLGLDGKTYRQIVEPLVAGLQDLLPRVLAPLQSAWRMPLAMGRFGLAAIRSAESLAKRFEAPATQALIAGLGAHSIARLDAAASAGVALLLAASGHVAGWPIARGGSQAITDALIAHLRELGGTVVIDRWISSLDEFAPTAPVFLDTTPAAAARIAGDRVDDRLGRRLARWSHGPGSHKVDWILSDPIPWADSLSSQSATVHLGGSFEEIAASEAAALAGRPPQNPFAIVTQPSLFDDSRAPAGRHIAWGYCHVPAGYSDDATEELEAQIERFAPGFIDTIVARHVQTATELAAYNPNYVGGDIGGGAMSLRQLLVRPRVGRNPYRIGHLTYLCSSSTPPGAGVHGMCGYNAVRYSARELQGDDS